MPNQFIALTGGAYETNWKGGSVQRSVNYFSEQIPQNMGEPIQYVYYPRPGLTLEAFGPNTGFGWRCLYTATNGDLWGVNGNQVFWIDVSGSVNLVGTLTPLTQDDMAPRYTPVSMVDNGTLMLIVDGSSTGWQANVISHDGLINFQGGQGDVFNGFPGGTRAEYSDTFFITNEPNNFEFNVSNSEENQWDALNFASKVGKADPIQVVAVIQRVLWLIGTQSLEIWINSGGSGIGALTNNTFPYQALPTAQFDIGCVAPYSLARGTSELFWLTQNQYGQGLVFRGIGQNVNEISTYYIAREISTYSRIDDAIGMLWQWAGHSYYMLTFPQADKTWVYDLSNGQWHEEMWLDDNGKEHRHRANCMTSAYGKVYCGDYANSNVYSLDPNNFTDNGQEIRCIRSFPHQIDMEGNARIEFKSLIARMQVGSKQGSTNNTVFLQSAFENPDGTILQDYTNSADVGAVFTKDSGVNAVILNDAVVGAVGGSSLYAIEGVSANADYELTMKVQPTSYSLVETTGSETFVICRANGSNEGYQMAISSDGTKYNLTLNVMGTATTVTVALGTLTSGVYIASLTMQQQSVSVGVQRSQDGLWLAPSGTWVGSIISAISIQDSTYAGPGANLWGGTWT